MGIIRDKNRAGQSTILPIIGKTVFDEEGLAEVESEEIAKAVANAVEGIEAVGAEKEVETESVEKKNSGESSDQDEVDDGEAEISDEKAAIIKELYDLKLNELKRLAKQYTDRNKLKKGEWNTLNRGDLIDYLIEKL